MPKSPKYIVISLGGSVVSIAEGINVPYIKEFGKVIEEQVAKGNKFVIVTGGGYMNKLLVDSLRNDIESMSTLDDIGIDVTRINAKVVSALLKSKLDVYPVVVKDLDSIKAASRVSDVVILGGLMPGITTDTVSVAACEAVGGKLLINVSSVAYVYDRNPSEPGAKKFTSMSYDQLIDLAGKYDQRNPRTNFVFDVIASKLARRSKIELRFVDKSISSLKKALNGQRHDGTIVKA
ncbi:MAG: UMP kinase [Candidatus Micrarchaeia archaeon]